MAITSFKDLAQAVIDMPTKSRVAAVAANDSHTIEAVATAQRDGLVQGILIGQQSVIEKLLVEQNEDVANFTIINADTVETSLATAVQLIKDGQADILMKGKLETADFMRAILNKENKLRKSPLLSVVGLYEMASYPKLLAVTDQAINTYPDLDAKKAITENAVNVLSCLGFEKVKVGVLAAVEKVNPKLKETVDGDALQTMNREGWLPQAEVCGPISFDLAVSKEAAQIKGFDNEVAGDADLLVCPDLVCGNVLVKALTCLAGATTAGTVVGATVPVVLVPRSAEAAEKYYSIALAAYMADKL
jgi:phosphate butyryltransferase